MIGFIVIGLIVCIAFGAGLYFGYAISQHRLSEKSENKLA